MTDTPDISRRKLLAGLGTVGLASAGAGFATSAYFSDREDFGNNSIVAGTLDMKLAAEEYYSDWSDDEAEFARMAADDASTDIRLPAPDGNPDAQDIAIDIIGDSYEEFVATLATGDTVNGGLADPATDTELCGTEKDANGSAIIGIDDVKPGDFGGAQFAFELCDNPGYVWLQGVLEAASENGLTEPESEDPDEQEGVVELLDEIQVAYGQGSIQDTSAFEDTPTGFQPTNQQTLREFLDMASSGSGIPLAGDIAASEGGGSGRNCFNGEGTVHEVSVIWWLPVDHANEIQTDSVEFSLGFYTEQCRHNDGSGMEPEETATGSPTSTPGSGGTDAFDYTFGSSDAVVGSSLNGIEVNYPSGSGAVSNATVDSVSLDGQDVSGDQSGTATSNNGDTLTISFGGSFQIADGDELALTLSNVSEPASPYTVSVVVNPQSGATSFTESF
jgi:predicted ribosomally synthesized peptide with SipW-like signal peptide